ncbi:thioether cross-link-forming SCIFF peptide maturase [Clostridiaceae bacterium]|nr:thioether cross-link-forming SCIFF peptide maturase [Clostridiaceae bacterium]
MIHQYKNNGYNIIMDIASGSVHVVDDVVYDVVALMDFWRQEHSCLFKESEASYRPDQVAPDTQPHNPFCPNQTVPKLLSQELRRHIQNKLSPSYQEQEIREALDEIQQLIHEEELFTKDTYQEYVSDFKKRETVVKALCLHIAHDCNLGCKYCFAEEGEYHGRRALMSFEVGKKALDFLIANSGNRRNLEVDFFGGEPLMNWEVVKQLVAYGRSREQECNKRFRFTLTTNGILLNDEIMEFCNQEMSNVVLSLDGRREVNDFMRPVRSGQKSSYDIIVPKFQKFARSRKGKDYYVRGTFTRHNLDFSEDVKHFADLGFEQMSIEPVVASKEEPYAIREEDLPRILEEYDRLAVEYIKRKKEGRGFTFFHFMIDLDQGPCVAKRLSGCGSGTEYLAVTPWGDLYPCHQFVGQEDFLMGNVNEGVLRTDLRDEFKLCNVYAKEKCRNCFARFYCSGGCAANSWQFHQSITDAYDIGCQMQKKRIECAIMIKAALAENEN